MATNLTPAEAEAEAKAKAEAEAKAKAEAEAKAKAEAEAKAKKYYVAEGKSICTAGGIFGGGKEISLIKCKANKEVFDDLIKRKLIVKHK
jgi:membrane protein involved in colicin uptake